MTNPFAANPMLLASAVMQGERIGQARAAQQQQIAERTRQNMIEGYKMQAMMAQEAARDGAEERQLARQMFADEMATRKMVFSEMMQNANLGLRLDERDYRRERDMTMDERYEENLGLRLDERDYRRERDMTMDERYMENLRLSGERHKEQMELRRKETEARLERERRLGAGSTSGGRAQTPIDVMQMFTGNRTVPRQGIPQYREGVQALSNSQQAQGIESMIGAAESSGIVPWFARGMVGPARDMAGQAAATQFDMAGDKFMEAQMAKPFREPFTTTKQLDVTEQVLEAIRGLDGGIDNDAIEPAYYIDNLIAAGEVLAQNPSPALKSTAERIMARPEVPEELRESLKRAYTPPPGGLPSRPAAAGEKKTTARTLLDYE